MCIACAANGLTASWSTFRHDLGAPRGISRIPLLLAATGTTATATGVSTTDALLDGATWNGTITYSFPDRPSDYEAGYAEALNGFAPVSFSQMQAARYILEGTSPFSGRPKAALTPVEGFTLANLVDMGFGGSDIRIARSQ